MVLPAVPVMPMLGPLQRSSNRSPRHESARSASTELRDPRRDLGRPDVEVCDLGLTGVGIEVDAGLDVDPELTQLAAPRRARAPGSRAAPRSPRRRAVARAPPRRRRTPRSGHPHLDHRGSTSFSRTKARITSSRPGAPSSCKQVRRTAHRRGDDAVREQAVPRRGSCSTPNPPLSRRSHASPGSSSVYPHER